MAKPPEENTAFLREVDDELRRDQLTTFWERWRVAIIGGLVAFLMVLGGVLFWQSSRRDAAAADGQLLEETLKSLEQGDMKAAPANLAKLEQSSVPAYRATARMVQGAMASLQGNAKAALGKYAEVAKDDGAPEAIRQAALVRQTAMEFDMIQPQVVIDRMKPLAIPGDPWFGSAGEMTGLALIRLNRPEQAGAMFAAIAKDKNVPESIRRRATQMAGSLGVDAVDDPEALKALDPTAPAGAGGETGQKEPAQ